VSPILISLIIFACVFGGALLGFGLRRVLPDDHRDPESKDVVRLAVGLIGTMAALVLGLLIGSAKTKYDTQKDQLTNLCAKVALLDQALAIYGPDAKPIRGLLRDMVERSWDEIWNGGPAPQSAQADAIYENIMNLVPKDDAQREVRRQAVDMVVDLGRLRWLMRTQRGSAIATPILVVLVLWFTFIFVSYGFFARGKKTVTVTLFFSALSVAAAIFLMMEMDGPFNGLLRISDRPLRAVLAKIDR
jgi:hypothetical protein